MQGHLVVFARACKQSGDFEITLVFGWKEHVGSVKVSGNARKPLQFEQNFFQKKTTNLQLTVTELSSLRPQAVSCMVLLGQSFHLS